MVGGIAVAVIVAVRGGDDDDDVAGPDTTTTTEAPLSDEAQELVDLLAESRELDLHLVFEPTEPGAGGATLVVDVWWKGDRAAQRLTASAGGQTEQAIAYVLPGGNVICQRPPGDEWACQPSVSVATEAGEAAGIIDALASDLGGKEVTVEEARVGEHEARCFTIEGATGGAVCVTDEGIPVRFTLGTSQMELVSLERSVDDDVFEPPAEVVEPSTTSTTAP
jgi:hypothetical protein